MLFSAIYKKSRLPLSDFQKVKIAFYTQLNRIFPMFVWENEST
jgi:hypothetical protein